MYNFNDIDISIKQRLILIVDNEAANIQILNRAIGGESKTIFALNGPDALNLCAEKNPDLVLLDIDMPGMDGFEVLKRLKENPKTSAIPVIFVTALDNEEDEETGLKLGAADFIPKPIRPGVVKLRINNHLRLKCYREKLEALSFLDGLTGIYNRRFFDAALEKEWARCLRNHTKLSMLLIDIDHFKQYNDYYGHLEGDVCLKKTASALNRTLKRSADILARYGGEEFVALLPSTDEAGLKIMAESLRTAIIDLNIPHKKSPTAKNLTISLGGVTKAPKISETSASFLEEADKCLYKSKNSGRNRATMCCC